MTPTITMTALRKKEELMKMSWIRENLMTSKLHHVALVACELSYFSAHQWLEHVTLCTFLCSEEEDDEYSDDDDVSWKVRRASAKCLTVILGSRAEMLTDFYHTVSPILISRFKGQAAKLK